MFGEEKPDSWKWIPYILIIGAIVFLFFDPFGMENTQIKYLVSVAPVDPLAPPGVEPPPENPPAALQNLVVGSGDFPGTVNTGPQTPPTKTWPQSGNGTWINVGTDADGFIFNGCVKTTAPGVSITNSEIRGNCATAQLYDEAGGGTFEYNNIFDVGRAGASAVGCGTNSRFFRNNIKGGADGVKGALNCKIIENYIHDLDEYDTGFGGTGNDGVHIEDAGTTGMLVQKNTFENTCGKSGIDKQGCAGVVFINNGASGNTVDGNYIKKWDGPSAGFIFHMASAGANNIKNNVVECAAVTGFGVQSGGASTFTNNTSC